MGADEMEVNALLADSVVTAEGKLYVQGGGWTNLSGEIPLRQDRIGIAILIYVPYTATNEEHELDISLQDEDGNEMPLGDAPPGVETVDGRIRHFKTHFNVGRPPTLPPGDEQAVPFGLNINRLRFDRATRYTFVIAIDGTPMKKLPFRVHPKQTKALSME